MLPTVDVIVPTHGGWHLTASCLRHLAAQEVPHRAWVVDNASPDGTPDRVREAFPRVEVIELGANRGFSVAVNRAVAEGNGEIIVLLNNDVDVAPGFLAALVDAFADPTIGSAAPLLLRPGGECIDGFGICVDRTLAGYVRLAGAPVHALAERAPPLFGPYGAAAAYRRRAWEEVAGLDERIFMYHEELDVAIRLRAAGWSPAEVSAARATHAGGATAGLGSAWQRRQGGFGRGYILRRYGILHSRLAPLALAIEGGVALADLALSRDAAALAGRIAGWKEARGLARRAPPRLDRMTVGLHTALRIRARAYRGA
jgi:N-acetylglucosaminyl-diphospho-decaprenol L-rhamnosyltransferase